MIQNIVKNMVSSSTFAILGYTMDNNIAGKLLISCNCISKPEANLHSACHTLAYTARVPHVGFVIDLFWCYKAVCGGCVISMNDKAS